MGKITFVFFATDYRWESLSSLRVNEKVGQRLSFRMAYIIPLFRCIWGQLLRSTSAQSLYKQPVSVEESWTKVTKEKIFRKVDTQQKFLDLVQTEARVVMDAYQNHRKKHIIDVWNERTNRKLKTDDLENDEYFIPLEIK